MAENVTIWDGCYNGGWRGVITPESFRHPAKMAYGLLNRIVQHGLARGWWKPGDLIGDPFGGVGTTGLVCSYHGLRSVSVELEPRFVGFQYENFFLHLGKWQAVGDPLPVYLHGDSRWFASAVRGAAGIATSPPYSNSLTRGDKLPDSENSERMREMGGRMEYGQAGGQIGELPDGGGPDAVLTSPPYAESLRRPGGDRLAEHFNVGKSTPGFKPAGPNSQAFQDSYGETDGQIGALSSGDLDGTVTSPPYEDGLGHGGGPATKTDEAKGLVDHKKLYLQAAGQIGNDTGETYWAAMACVYGQCWLALKPGGVMAVVVKDYVKKGERVPLCDQTLELLLRLGFQRVERIRAMLVKTQSHPGLFGEPVEKTTERKSFFRRLAEGKGSPKIDWEEVLVVRKETSDE